MDLTIQHLRFQCFCLHSGMVCTLQLAIHAISLQPPLSQLSATIINNWQLHSFRSADHMKFATCPMNLTSQPTYGIPQSMLNFQTIIASNADFTTQLHLES